MPPNRRKFHVHKHMIRYCKAKIEHACRSEQKLSMHLVLNMFIFTRTLVTYARTIFKPRCCLNFQSMRTQAEPTYIAHNMFGQIKMEIPWYINRHHCTVCQDFAINPSTLWVPLQYKIGTSMDCINPYRPYQLGTSMDCKYGPYPQINP